MSGIGNFKRTIFHTNVSGEKHDDYVFLDFFILLKGLRAGEFSKIPVFYN